MQASLQEKRIAIIGGGLGGLASALRLSKMGAKVTLFEKNSRLGGKIAEHRWNDYRWDMGPSLFTMPHVIKDLFQFLEEPFSLNLIPVTPTCRYFWQDGVVIDEDEVFFNRPDVKKFLQYAQGIYELSGEAFLQNPPHRFWKAFTLSNLPKLRHLPKITTFATLSQKVRAFFQDPHLQQLFERFATYNGSSPFKAQATFNIIPYVEAHFGAWYVEGGMRQIPEILAKLATQRGIELRMNSQVISIDENGLSITSEKKEKFDLYLVNGDVIRAHEDLIRFSGYEKKLSSLKKYPLSLSGFVILLGVRKKYSQLSHHNIFFSKDYKNEFHELFEEKKLPEDPTIYICITSQTDPDDAPPGCENFFVLLNAPSEMIKNNWNDQKNRILKHIINKLEQAGLDDLSNHIEYSYAFSPEDFANRDLSTHGSLYGWASHHIHSSLFRPPLRSPLSPNLYFVGGTTHPGGGIPLVLLSAKMVTEEILRNHGS
jgi:phytoene desaturase